jgi:prevent-host-death family protein
MVAVGIRDLKARLSSFIKKVQEGEGVVITDHGEEVAVIVPISRERRAIRQLIKAGKAQWSGKKPKGLKGIVIKGKPLSETVLEERQ